MSSIFSSYQEVINFLRNGGVVVIPTDTIYGIVASALNPNAVERLYAVKQRRPDKPAIILISDFAQLGQFNVELTLAMNQTLSQLWPGPTSVVLPCSDRDLAYLHRGTDSLAFRLPHHPELEALLDRTGPLLAPSANPEGKPPASTVSAAQAYFGDHIDGYVDGGVRPAPPSRLIRLQPDGSYEVLRG